MAAYEIEFPDAEEREAWQDRFFSGASPEKAMETEYSDEELEPVKIRLRKEEDRKLILSAAYPPSMEEDEIQKKLQMTLLPGQTLTRTRHLPPVCFEKNGWLCQTLLGCYEEVSGIKGEPEILHGATYARVMPNIVPFGPSFPGQRDIAHEPDEWMDRKDLLMNAKIYGLAMLRLAGGKEEGHETSH